MTIHNPSSRWLFGGWLEILFHSRKIVWATFIFIKQFNDELIISDYSKLNEFLQKFSKTHQNLFVSIIFFKKISKICSLLVPNCPNQNGCTGLPDMQQKFIFGAAGDWRASPVFILTTHGTFKKWKRQIFKIISKFIKHHLI